LKTITVDNNQKLNFTEQEQPSINTDECLIQVKAIGVNRADLLQRAGKYPAPPGESPILGLEVSGDIVACGKDVHRWQVNDKVFALVAGGGYAEYVKVKATQLLSLPQSFSYQQGAATAEVFLTAYQSLFTIANLQSKQSVLIHAGASGVGTAAIQLAKAKQCYVVVTVGSDEKAKACLALGADVAINYHHQDFVAWSTEHHKKGFDIIVDVVAGNYLNKNIQVAALDAHIVILSLLGGRFSDNVDIAKLLMKRLTFTASTLRNRDHQYKAMLVKQFATDFYHQLVEGKIKPVIDSEFLWQQADQAHQKMGNNENIGKLVLTLP